MALIRATWVRHFLARPWVAVCVYLLLCLASATVHAQTPQILLPAKVGLLMIDSASPPADAAAWMPVGLPDNWAHRDFHPEPLPAWYRIEFSVPENFRQGGSWSAYLPYLYHGGDFFLNGQPISSIAQTTDIIHAKWERPHLLALPYGAAGQSLVAGRNVLHLRISASHEKGWVVKIPAISIGPSQSLQEIYERRLFLVRTIPQFTSAACFITAMFVLFIWWRRRSETLFGVFGLIMLFWSVCTLTFVIETLPPIQWGIWRMCYHFATGGFVVMLTIFAFRSANLIRPKMERGLVIYWLLGPVVEVLSGSGAGYWMNNVWTGGFLVTVPVTISMALAGAWRQGTASMIALMLSVIAAVMAATHDYFILVSAPWFAQLAPQWVAERIFLLVYVSDAMLLIMGVVLVLRFINALGDLEVLNQTLDRRVAEREVVIQNNFQRLVDLEGQRQAAEERQRIMQDMHDGLGAQLFSSLSRVERSAMSQQDMADSLHGCIDEMRLAIDSLSNCEDGFEVTFNNFRYRWEAQLKALGIASTWQVNIAPHSTQLAPHNGLQVLRILQEALTNVLKHAKAGQVKISLHWDGETLSAQVADNGQGLHGSPSPQNRGVSNMRNRTTRLGGTMTLERRDAQTILSLIVPTQALT